MVSAQPFCEARYKISAVVFGDGVNRTLMALVEEHPAVRHDGRACG
jgi:hypothetical protein